jgi:hypothetical protein
MKMIMNNNIIILSLLLLIVISCQAESRSELRKRVSNANLAAHKQKNRANDCEQNLKNYKHNVENKYIIIDNDKEYIALDKNNNYIGTIIDKFNMARTYGTIFKNQNRTIIPNNYAIFYMDIDYKNIFIALPPGEYNSNKISFPIKSISSVKVPSGYSVILFDNDNLNGNYVYLSSNETNLHDKNFNDRTVSIQIIPNNKKNINHIVNIYEQKDFNGFNQGLSEKNNAKPVELSLKFFTSIMIADGYTLEIFYKNKLVENINSNISILCIPIDNQRICQNKLSTEFFTFNIVSTKQTVLELYEDINFNGKKTITYDMEGNYETISFNQNSISSIKISNDYEVELYEGKNYDGNSIIITGNVKDLRQYAFNDKINSYKIKSNYNKLDDKVSIYHTSKFEAEIQYFSVGKYYCSTENQKILDWCNSRLLNNLSIKIPTGYIVQVTNTGILWNSNVNITKDYSNFADALQGLTNFDFLEVVKL